MPGKLGFQLGAFAGMFFTVMTSSGSFAQMITPSARDGVNPGAFSTGSAGVSRSPLNTASATLSEGRELGVPLGEFKEQYRWTDSDLAYMAVPRLFHFSGRVSAGWWYDDNITLSHEGAPNPRVADSYFDLRPSLSLTVGPIRGLTAALTYDADFQWYTSDKVDNAFNQHVGLNFNFNQAGGGRLRWYLNTSYAAVDGSNVDIGTRVQQNATYINGGITYDLSGKVTLGAGVTTELLDYSGNFFPSDNYTFSAFVDYEVSPKVKLGLGATYGFTSVQGGTDYRTYQGDFRVSWAPTSRLSVSSAFGAMYQKSIQGGFDQVSPTVTLNLNYDVFGTGKTSATLSVYRNYHPSALLLNQAYWSNGVVLNYSQHLAERLQLAIAFGYEFAEYQATAANVFANRRDNFFYIRPNLTYAITNNLSASLFYQYSRDDSTGYGSAPFVDNVVGVMLNFGF